jgi:hypothetical protein
MKKYIITSIALTVVLLALTGCSMTGRISQTNINMVAAGHKIRANIDGFAETDFLATPASRTRRVVITSQQFGDIVIEPSRVSLGSMEWTNIPDGAPITLNISAKKYSVQWTTNQ